MLQEKLTGKVAIVTGAAQGMGKTIAEMLAHHGANVVLSDINAKKVQSAAESVKGLGLKTDVTDEQEVQNMVKRTIEHYGAVDILVNNAGILKPTKLDNITKQEWDLVINVNLTGTFLCTKAVLGIMKERKFGRIVNMSSSAGKSVSTLGGAHYTAAKAAVLGLTRATAKEVASYGITANAICPGLINTEMVRSQCSNKRIADYENSFPISRLGTAQEVANLVLFLIADAPYITGASLDINGGDLMI